MLSSLERRLLYLFNFDENQSQGPQHTANLFLSHEEKIISFIIFNSFQTEWGSFWLQGNYRATAHLNPLFAQYSFSMHYILAFL